MTAPITPPATKRLSIDDIETALTALIQERVGHLEAIARAARLLATALDEADRDTTNLAFRDRVVMPARLVLDAAIKRLDRVEALRARIAEGKR